MSELLGVSQTVVEKNNKILIVREPGQFQWSLPGGIARSSEGPRETLLRKLGEQFTEWRLADPLVILHYFERTADNPRPTTIFLAKIDGVMVPNPSRIADTRWVDPIAENLEYDLPCQVIRSIISLRIKRAKLARRPAKILD